MVLNVLLVGLIIEFILTLFIFKNDFLSPAVIFNGVFLMSAMNLRMMVDFWKVELHPITTGIILSGVLIFTIVGYVTSITKMRVPNKIKDQKIKTIYIPNMTLDLLIIVYALVIVLSMISTIRSKGLGYSFSSLLLNYVTAIEGEETLNLPAVLSILFMLGSVSGYIWCYLLAEQWVNKKLNWRFVILVLEVVLMGFSVGKRGESVAVLVSLVFDLLILLRRAGKGKNKRRSKKVYVSIAFIIIIIPLAFQTISNTMGRDSYLFNPFEYLSIYIGAPILNLDISVANGGFKHPVPMSETFRSLYRAVGHNLGIDQFIYNSDRRFLTSVNGKRIGNVDTTFYDFFHDGGFIGVIILVAIMSVIIYRLYKSVKLKNDEHNMIRIIVYSYMLWLVARSFFANSFYEWITLSTIRTLLIWFLIEWILNKGLKFRRVKTSSFFQ